MNKYAWPALNSIVIIILVSFYLFYSGKPKIAFVYNQKVFDSFLGKVELEHKLKTEQSRNRKQLDSISSLIQSGRKDLEGVYNHTAETAGMREQEMSGRYTADIWKHINDAISEYGKKNGYDFIFGASGDGSLMHAEKANDVTEEVVKHLNEAYAK